MSRFQKHLDAGQQHLAQATPMTTEQHLLAAVAETVTALAISVQNLRCDLSGGAKRHDQEGA